MYIYQENINKTFKQVREHGSKKQINKNHNKKHHKKSLVEEPGQLQSRQPLLSYFPCLPLALPAMIKTKIIIIYMYLQPGTEP